MRYHLDFIPRASWQPNTDPADQRWTRTPNIFSGTEDEVTIECSELESEYGFAVTFRAVAIESTPEEEGLHHYCPSCGGEQVISVNVCGPGSAQCKCQCPDGPCEHQWDGAWYESEDGRMGTSTCSRCGMHRIDHDLWVCP